MKMEKAKDVRNPNKYNEDQNLTLQHLLGTKKEKRVDDYMLGKRATMDSTVFL